MSRIIYRCIVILGGLLAVNCLDAQLIPVNFDSIRSLPAENLYAFVEENIREVSNQNFEEGTELAGLLLQTATQNDNAYQQAQAHVHLGYSAYLSGNFEASLENNLAAIAIFDSLEMPAKKGKALTELANHTKKFERYDQALGYLKQARAACSEAKDSLCLSVSYDNSGVIYMYQGKLEEARDAFEKTLEIRLKIGDQEGLGYVYNNFSWLEMELGNFAASLNWLEKSTAIRKELNDQQGMAININNMAEIALAQERFDEAITYLERSIELSSKIGFNDLRRHSLGLLAQAHESNGDYQKANEFLRKSQALNDSLYNEKMTQQVAEMQEKYESEQKEKVIAEQELVVQQRTTWLIGAISVTATLLLGMVFLVVRQREKQAHLRREAQQRAQNRIQQERLRLSRDLHDHLGAEITMVVSALSKKIFLAASDEEKSEWTRIRDNAKGAMAELRETIWAIRQEGGSLSEFTAKLQEFTGRSDEIVLEIDAEKDITASLSPMQSLTLYRVGQEVITNAVKHGKASTIRLEITQPRANWIRFTFRDNGAGLAQNSPPDGGNGLPNIRQRIEELQGRTEFRLAPGKGGEIMVEIPISIT